MVRRAVAETSQTAQPWIGTGKWNTYRAVSGVHCDKQDVLCPQSCPVKCSLIITVRNIAGKINYITIDKTVKNKPNKKGTPRKRATQGHLFLRIVFLPVRLQGVSKTSWKRALVCGFTYFGLNQSAAIILLSKGGKSILAHSGFSLGILMLERVTRRLHDAETKNGISKSANLGVDRIAFERAPILALNSSLDLILWWELDTYHFEI